MQSQSQLVPQQQQQYPPTPSHQQNKQQQQQQQGGISSQQIHHPGYGRYLKSIKLEEGEEAFIAKLEFEQLPEELVQCIAKAQQKVQHRIIEDLFFSIDQNSILNVEIGRVGLKKLNPYEAVLKIVEKVDQMIQLIEQNIFQFPNVSRVNFLFFCIELSHSFFGSESFKSQFLIRISNILFTDIYEEIRMQDKRKEYNSHFFITMRRYVHQKEELPWESRWRHDSEYLISNSFSESDLWIMKLETMFLMQYLMLTYINSDNPSELPLSNYDPNFFTSCIRVIPNVNSMTLQFQRTRQRFESLSHDFLNFVRNNPLHLYKSLPFSIIFSHLECRHCNEFVKDLRYSLTEFERLFISAANNNNNTAVTSGDAAVAAAASAKEAKYEYHQKRMELKQKKQSDFLGFKGSTGMKHQRTCMINLSVTQPLFMQLHSLKDLESITPIVLQFESDLEAIYFNYFNFLRIQFNNVLKFDVLPPIKKQTYNSLFHLLSQNNQSASPANSGGLVEKQIGVSFSYQSYEMLEMMIRCIKWLSSTLNTFFRSYYAYCLLCNGPANRNSSANQPNGGRLHGQELKFSAITDEFREKPVVFVSVSNPNANFELLIKIKESQQKAPKPQGMMRMPDNITYVTVATNPLKQLPKQSLEEKELFNYLLNSMNHHELEKQSQEYQKGHLDRLQNYILESWKESSAAAASAVPAVQANGTGTGTTPTASAQSSSSSSLNCLRSPAALVTYILKSQFQNQYFMSQTGLDCTKKYKDIGKGEKLESLFQVILYTDVNRLIPRHIIGIFQKANGEFGIFSNLRTEIFPLNKIEHFGQYLLNI